MPERMKEENEILKDSVKKSFIWKSHVKHGKYHYLTEEESKMGSDMIDLQIVLGLQTCKTKGDVMELLSDVRLNERQKTNQKWNDRINKRITELKDKITNWMIATPKEAGFDYELKLRIEELEKLKEPEIPILTKKQTHKLIRDLVKKEEKLKDEKE